MRRARLVPVCAALLGAGALFAACGGVSPALQPSDAGGGEAGVGNDAGAAADGPRSDATAACGAAGQACCDGTACNANLMCSGGTCALACGGPGAPCCNGAACNPMLSCTAGVCAGSCGAVGSPCCAVGAACAPLLACVAGTCDVAPSQDGGAADASPGGPDACTGIACQVASCGGGQPTTVTGTVMDPGGHHAIYNASVYVPGTAGGVLPAIPSGVQSGACFCAGIYDGVQAVAATSSAVDGTFTLANVPSGTHIPVVVQLGKWRKEIHLTTVNPCATTAAGVITLPASGSDGDYASLPSLAVSTGGADSLECLLPRIGISEAEFTGDPSTSSLHVHVFQGTGGNTTQSPAAPVSATSLWDSTADLERYDLVLLSCEGMPTTTPNAAAIAGYTAAGGRVFAEHYHSAFFANQPQFPNVASWLPDTSPYLAAISDVVATTLPQGGPFPQGLAMSAWLGDAGALPNGQLQVPSPRYDALVAAGNASTPWLVTATSVTPPSTQAFTWPMPLPGDAGAGPACGEVLYTDIHDSQNATAVDYTTSPIVPTGCAGTAALTADEEALEFLFFTMLSCPAPPPMGP